MVTYSYDYIIKDIGILTEYRGCSNVVVWVEIVYIVKRLDTDNPEYNFEYRCTSSSTTIDVFNENTFDPNNFLSKELLNTSIVRSWIDPNIPQFRIDGWKAEAEAEFQSRIERLEEGKNISTVDAPWIQYGD